MRNIIIIVLLIGVVVVTSPVVLDHLVLTLRAWGVI